MQQPVTLFRSLRSADCEERAFMLSAVGISSAVAFDGSAYLLNVDAPDAALAVEHLAKYELERRPPPPAPPPPRLHARAWLGALGYVAVLIAVSLIVAAGIWPGAFRAGDLDGAAVQAGEWWRAWTALTLHVDSAHLLANATIGAWFGYLAARLMGNGHAWFLIVGGAALANVCEALVGPEWHRAVGASTAVFTALGLLCAYGWTRVPRGAGTAARRFAQRWAPLVAGLALLGWFGSEGEHTDLVAHLFGFGAGIGMGLLATLRVSQAVMRRTPQLLSAGLALGSLALAWSLALR